MSQLTKSSTRFRNSFFSLMGVLIELMGSFIRS